ncbi:MAG: class I SAM-dependent methyltransferase [Candidatus Pacebacteria bacterium]|nr:class I SAM-dependent methyltransferase [Candidatus Paceibacterota bacterium]
MNFRPDTITPKDLDSAPQLPPIFQMISSGEPTPRIVRQIAKDYATGDKEKVFLGLQELKRRGAGSSSVEALTGELGFIAEKILTEKLEDSEMESILGINRFAQLHPEDNLSHRQHLFNLYEQAYKKKYTTLSYLDFVFKIRNRDKNAHKNGTTENEIVPIAATFGGSEPVALELLTPMGVLELREKKKPNFLLLGSLGAISANQFQKYAKKINPNSAVHVIDINDGSIKLLKNDPGQAERHLVQADAMQLPYQDESMDYITTNYLFHFLYIYRLNTSGTEAQAEEETRKDLINLFREASRVLRPGGKLYIEEQSYGILKDRKDKSFQNEILECAKKAGLTKFTIAKKIMRFGLGPEKSSAKIDENGFAHYGNTTLSIDDNSTDFVGIFEKPKA